MFLFHNHVAIIEICNSGPFYCSNIVSTNLATVKSAWLQLHSVFISPSVNKLVDDKRKGEMYPPWFLSIKLPSKEFLCLKISSLIGWTVVLIDWIQDLDIFMKILNMSCTDSLRKTNCFFIMFYQFIFWYHLYQIFSK